MSDGPTLSRVYRDLLTFQWACFAAALALTVAALYVGGKDGIGVAMLTAPGFIAAGGLRDWLTKRFPDGGGGQ